MGTTLGWGAPLLLLSPGWFCSHLGLSQRFGSITRERGVGEGGVGCSPQLGVLLWDVSSFQLPFPFWRNRRSGGTGARGRNGRRGGRSAPQPNRAADRHARPNDRAEGRGLGPRLEAKNLCKQHPWLSGDVVTQTAWLLSADAGAGSERNVLGKFFILFFFFFFKI